MYSTPPNGDPFGNTVPFDEYPLIRRPRLSSNAVELEFLRRDDAAGPKDLFLI